MFLIPALLGLLAQVAPTLIGLVTDSPKAAEVTQKVVSVVQAVTGTTTQEAAVAAISANPDLALQVQVQLAQVALEYAKLAAAADAAQIAVNNTQAASGSLYVAGARPAYMWFGVFAMAYSMIFQALIQAFMQLWQPHFTLPAVDTSQLWPLVFGLLGLGGFRTYEKTQGVATQSILPARR